MRHFFNSIERIIALQYHALQLVDTPFVKFAMVPGGGIDCVHLNAYCYLKTGLLKAFNPPKYALDSGLHSTESALLKWFVGRPEFFRLPSVNAKLDNLLSGDTVCFNMGLSEHHVGLVLKPHEFIHVLPGRRVILSSLGESYYARHITAVFRPIES